VRQSEPFLIMAVACALIALLATLYLTEDNKAALMTYEINALQNQQSTLLRTQSDLKVQLDQLEALQRIQAEADAQGMVPVQPSATTYIDLPPVVDTVAPLPTLARAQP
jgi:cell division protein FtsL